MSADDTGEDDRCILNVQHCVLEMFSMASLQAQVILPPPQTQVTLPHRSPDSGSFVIVLMASCMC